LSKINSTSSGLISLFVGIITMIITLGYTLVVTRTFNPVELGTWGFINSLIIYPLIANKVVSYWATREVARNISSATSAIFFSGIMSILGIVIYIIAIFLLGSQTDADWNVLLLSTIMIPVLFIYNTLWAINYGTKPHVTTYGPLFIAIFQIPLVFFLVYYLEMGVSGLIISFTFANASSSVILGIYARKQLKNFFSLSFLKKWIKLSWVPIYPELTSAIFRSDVIIFSIITGSVFGIAYWTVANTITLLISKTGLLYNSTYAKTLQGGENSWFNTNLLHTFYFLIPFTVMTIVFSKPALFALNPIYESAVPILIILSLVMFVRTIGGAFLVFLMGYEKVDTNDDSSTKDYLSSKLIHLPTIKLIQNTFYLVMLAVGLLILMNFGISEIDLLIYWALLTLVFDIIYSSYLFSKIKEIFSIKLKFLSILKYTFLSIVIFVSFSQLTENTINYELPLIEYIIQLLIFILISLATYFISSIAIDKPAKLLIDQIIFNIKKNDTN
jgi:hypothetical protein